MMSREAAWRMFAGELNSSTVEKKNDEEKSPSYVVTPLGSMVNRVLIAGVLTDKENKGSETEPIWNGRICDVSGNFYFSISRFQPEAASAIVDIDTPSFVAVVGKVRTYTSDDGRVFISVRPEKIVKIDEETRNLWVLEAAKSLWERLVKLKKVYTNPDATVNDLVGMGFSKQEAEGITIALEQYGVPESSRYLKLMQNALRYLLPDDEIDFGLPENENDLPDEIDVPSTDDKKDDEIAVTVKKDVLLRIIEELGTSSNYGAPIEEVNRAAEAEGISAMEVEELASALMDDGVIYEPNLNYLKKI